MPKSYKRIRAYPSVDFNVRYSSVTCSHYGKSLFAESESRTLVFGYSRYNRPILMTAGLLIFYFLFADVRASLCFVFKPVNM